LPKGEYTVTCLDWVWCNLVRYNHVQVEGRCVHVVQFTRGVRCAHVSMVLSSSPSRRRAVRGAMILNKEVRIVEVRGRNPGVLVVTVPFLRERDTWVFPGNACGEEFARLHTQYDRQGIERGVRQGGCGRKKNRVCTDAKSGRGKRCGYRGKEGTGGYPDGI
jgi:hypothetical protein